MDRPSLAGVELDAERHAVGGGVGDDQIGQAVAVEIADRDRRKGILVGRERVFARVGEGALSVIDVDRAGAAHVGPARAVAQEQVEIAVAVEVGRRERAHVGDPRGEAWFARRVDRVREIAEAVVLHEATRHGRGAGDEIGVAVAVEVCERSAL